MEISDYAAYGGLVLGLINLGITYYKEFLKKGKLNVSDEEFFIFLKNIEPDAFLILINVRFLAQIETVTIKEVTLINQKAFTTQGHNNSQNHVCLKYAVPYKDINTDKSIYQEIEENINRQYDFSKTNMNDLTINKNGIKSLTFAAKIEGVRLSDQWDRIPEGGWSLRVKYDLKELIIPIDPIFRHIE